MENGEKSKDNINVGTKKKIPEFHVPITQINMRYYEIKRKQVKQNSKNDNIEKNNVFPKNNIFQERFSDYKINQVRNNTINSFYPRNYQMINEQDINENIEENNSQDDKDISFNKSIFGFSFLSTNDDDNNINLNFPKEKKIEFHDNNNNENIGFYGQMYQNREEEEKKKIEQNSLNEPNFSYMTQKVMNEIYEPNKFSMMGPPNNINFHFNPKSYINIYNNNYNTNKNFNVHNINNNYFSFTTNNTNI